MKSSLPEVDKPFRKSDYSHRKWSYYVNGGGNMSSSRHDSTRVDTTRYFQKSTRLYMAKNALADKSTKEMKQEAMQCIPRSVNLCRQMTRFNGHTT